MKRTLKRPVKAPTHRGTGHTCGECSLPCWNTENRNFKGEAFIGRCCWSNYGRIINGAGVVYTEREACEHFGAGVVHTEREACEHFEMKGEGNGN